MPVTEENIFIAAACGDKGIAFLKGDRPMGIRYREEEKPAAKGGAAAYTATVDGKAVTVEVSADGKEYTARDFVYDALTPGDGVKVIAKYTDEEYLAGYAAITETKVGKGRIIMMGAALDNERYAKFIGSLARELGIEVEHG